MDADQHLHIWKYHLSIPGLEFPSAPTRQKLYGFSQQNSRISGRVEETRISKSFEADSGDRTDAGAGPIWLRSEQLPTNLGPC